MFAAKELSRNPSYSAVPNTSSEFTALSDGSSSLIRQSQSSSSSSSLFNRVSSFYAGLSVPQRIFSGCIFAAVIGGIIGGALAAKKVTPSPGPTGICAWTDYRLPTNVLPLNYSTIWSPATDGLSYIAPFDYGGITTINTIVMSSDTSCVLLHSVGLAVTTITVSKNGGNAQSVGWSNDLINERLVISTSSAAAIIGDSLRITVTYRAPLGLNNVGLYASTFINDAGVTVTMLATQFEATAARRAFPCMDEPSLKANFTLTLDGLPVGYTALGNMPVATTAVRSDGGTTVTFATTPRMSTYLVALVAGPLVSVVFPKPVGRGNIPVAGWAVARANNSRLLGYAVEACAAIVPHYEDLFGIAFPLPKLDMVAIPDFAAGAMENWGLITYRETAMLANTTTSSAAELQRVVVVVAHELAHQW
jgi:aminopeptidase N